MPRVEVVDYEKAKKDGLKLLIGVQIGILGYILRIGLYR